MRVEVNIERGDDGSYWAYVGSENVPFGILGDGNTVEDAKKDFLNCYKEMKTYYFETRNKCIECEFEFDQT